MIGCSKEKKVDQISQGQWKVLSYFPANTYYLFYMNISGLKNKSFPGNYLQNDVKEKSQSKWLSEIENKTGIGFNNGINELYISNSSNQNYAAAITFSDDKKKIINYLDDEKEFTKSGEYFINKKSGSFYYLPDNSTLMMFNKKDYLDKLLLHQNKNIKYNKEFVELLNDISYKKQYWFALNRDTLAYALIKKIIGSSDKQVESIIKNVKNASLSLSIDEEVLLESSWGFKTYTDAAIFSGAIKTALTMDLLSGKSPELNKLLKKTIVNREGNKVSLNLKLNSNDLQEINKLKYFEGIN